MIRDLSESLQALLHDPNSYGDGQTVDFVVTVHHLVDAQPPGQKTLDLFLYDIREHLELRSSVPDVAVNPGGVGRLVTPPPLRLLASYLLTAWSGTDGEDGTLVEHGMLGRAAVAIARSPILPEEHRVGGLKNMTPPPALALGQPEGGRGLAEWWTAFGKKPRAALRVTATLAVPLTTQPTPVPEARELRVRVTSASGPVPTLDRAGPFVAAGRVIDAAGAAVAGAVVRIDGVAGSATSDTLGRFTLGLHPGGQITLRVVPRAGDVEVVQTLTLPATSADGLSVVVPDHP